MSHLSVILVEHTGHVLAALTRATEPPRDEPVSALVGAGLPVRFNLTVAAVTTAHAITIPADLLAAATVADGATVFDDPLAVQVVEGEHNGQPVTELQPYTATATLAVSTSQLTITAAGVGTVARPVAVVLEQSGDRVVRESTIPQGQSAITLALTLAPGNVAGRGVPRGPRARAG